MPSIPVRTGTAAAPARKVRREREDRWGAGTWLASCMGCSPSRGSGRLSGLVDLPQLALGPLDGVFRGQSLDALREHVDEDVLGQRLGGFPARGAGVADLARVLQGLREYRGLGILPPERMVLIGPRGGTPGGVHGLAGRGGPGTVHVVTDEILRKFLVLAVLHHTAVPGGEPVEAAGRPGRVVPVTRPPCRVGDV